MGPCMCGACDCPSCGPAQGFDPEWDKAIYLAEWRVLCTPIVIAEALDDLCARDDQPVDVDALCVPDFDAEGKTPDQLLAVMLNGSDPAALRARTALRDRIEQLGWVQERMQSEAERILEQQKLEMAE